MKNIKEIKEKIIPILEQNDVKKMSIFGSVARGEENKDSDIDIIVEFNKDKSLFDIVRIERQIKKVLGRRVDLLTPKSIHPLLLDHIMKDQVQIYG